MKASLIFTRHLESKHRGIVPEEKQKPVEVEEPKVDKAEPKEVVSPLTEPIQKKRRGRKPGIKKIEPANVFNIENREVVIEFS